MENISINPCHINRLREVSRLCKVKLQSQEKAGDGSNKRLWEHFLTSDTALVDINAEVPGDRVVRDLRAAIRTRKSLTKFQLLFTEMFIQSLLKYIYGDQYAANELRIKEDNWVTDLYQFVFVCCVRRFGKTFIVGWFAACCLMTVPGIVITIFSPGQRQSIYMMELIRKLVKELCIELNVRPEVPENNSENYGIRIGNDYRKVRGLPAQEDTTRGTDGNCIIIEEGASMPVRFFVRVAMPVATPSQTAMIAISTILGSVMGKDNWFTTLMNLRMPDGRPYYAVYKFELACEQCIKLGLEADCNHKMGDLPFWHDEGKQHLANVIYTALGQQEALLNELKGIVRTENVTAFDSGLVRRMFNAKLNPLVTPEELDEDPLEIFCFIDPTGGGTGSEFAIISAFPYRGQYIRCGIELIPASRIRHYQDTIIMHLQMLRTLPRLQNTKILVATENNGPLLSAEICEAIDSCVGNIIFLNNDDFQITNVKLHKGSKKQTGGYGTHTSGEVLKNAWKLFQHGLAVGSLRFYRDMVCLHGSDKTRTPRVETLSKLERQHLDYAKVFKKPAKDTMPGFEDETYTFSGKHKGPDDGCKADQLNFFWMTQYITRPAVRRGGPPTLI